MKLTLFGKLVVAGVALLLAGGIWAFFLRDDAPAGPDLSVPAATAPFHYPFRPGELAKFEAKAISLEDYCSFYDSYSSGRGVPISFDAYVPPNAAQSPYYHYDPDTKREYVPAYFIDRSGRGLANVQDASQGTLDGLPSCSGDGVILLGFRRSERPTSPVIRVRGIIWFDSLSVNPSQQSSEAGAETRDAPVVLVGAATPRSPSQASDPPLDQKVINTALRQGPGIIRISRIEYGRKQTRVWIELVNTRNRALAPWTGLSDAQLREEGGPALSPGDGQDSGGDGSETDSTLIEDGSPLSDKLPASPVPPRGGGTLKGYLTFPAVDPAKTLYLSLPDFTTALGGANLPILIRIPPAARGQ